MKKGFTLVELLIVIAIIGVLSAVVVASIQGAKQVGSRECEPDCPRILGN